MIRIEQTENIARYNALAKVFILLVFLSNCKYIDSIVVKVLMDLIVLINQINEATNCPNYSLGISIRNETFNLSCKVNT